MKDCVVKNDGLAVAALEELNRRGDPDPIWEGLKVASSEDLIHKDTTDDLMMEQSEGPSWR